MIRSLFALSLALSWPLVAAETTINVTAHGAVPNSGQDATLAFRQALAAAKASNGPVTLVVPPGRYDFDLASATVRDCYTANSTETGSPQRHIALDLTELDNLTIEGPGATLMMRGQMTMLVAERCHGLTLRGVEFDFERPTFSEITAVEKGANYWIGAVHADSDYQILNGNSLRWIGPGMDTGYDQIQRYDPNTRSVTRNNSDPIGSPSAITDLGGGRLRFEGGGLGNVVNGITYQFRRARRNEVGMWFNHCSDVVMEDVAVRAMHGFGILSQYTENVTYSHLTVAPKPGSGRTCASPADILHFANCKGTVRILDSTLAASHDDAMNVHGTHLRVVAQPAPNQLRVRFMHHQSWGFEAFAPGDEIELVRPTTLLSYDSATVTAVQKTSDYEQVITLDKNVSGVTLNSDAVENVTWTPAVEMINCDISQVPTRGILLTTRKPILIQGNRFFRTTMHGILIEDDASGWYESGPVHNLTVRGNSFYECAESVIQISPHLSGSPAGPVHKNILVEDNDFFLSGNGAAYAATTDNIRFEGNRFHMGNGSSPLATSLVSTSNTTNLTFAGNTAGPASNPSLVLANGNFEAADPAAGASPGKLASWFASTPAATAVVNDGSRVLQLDGGAAVYQQLGSYDPRLGPYLKVAFDQLAVSGNSGPLEISLLAWDGRFTPADGTAPTTMDIVASRDFANVSGAASRRFTADLSGLTTGTRLWLRVASTAATVRVDGFTLTQSSPPDASTYSGWIDAAGLGGTEAMPDADPDHDGIPNLIEYVLKDNDPLKSDPPPLRLMFDGATGKPTFRYLPRATADVLVAAEYQTDGLNANGWQPVTNGVAGLALRQESDGSQWIDVVDTVAESLFVRLSAAAAPNPPPVVANASFENPDRSGANPAYSSGEPDNWTFTGSVNWGVEEIRDSRFGTIGAEGSRLTALGGDGDQVAYINLGNGGSSSGSATSAVVGNVAPNTTYTLIAAFGQRTSGDRHPDGSLGLTVDGIAVGTPTAFTGPSLSSGFNQKTFTWTSPGVGDPLIGKPLRVRMNFSYASASGGWQQAQFDRVRVSTN